MAGVSHLLLWQGVGIRFCLHWPLSGGVSDGDAKILSGHWVSGPIYTER